MTENKDKLEIRFYCNPCVKKEKSPIVKSILGGFGEYLTFRGINSKFKEKDCGLIKGVLKEGLVNHEYPSNSGLNSYNVDKILKILGTEKVNVAHTPDLDNPHWDILIVPEYLISNEGSNVYGKSTNYIRGKESLASIIISTADLDIKDELALQKGFVLGNRFAYLTEGECLNPRCVGSYMDHTKLENMAKNYKNNKEINLCGIKHRK